MTTWDAGRVAAFFDEYGEQEWLRFEDGQRTVGGLPTHIRMLERHVRAGDRVLDAGAGPGRFTLELQRLGANVTALDISPAQLDALRSRCPDVEAHVGDITDLSRFADLIRRDGPEISERAIRTQSSRTRTGTGTCR